MTAHSSLDCILGHRPWDTAPSEHERPVQPVARLEQLVLTAHGAYIKLPGNIGLPMQKFDAAVATFTKRGVPAEQASTEGFCVAHTALAELELTGRPVVLTFKEKEFTVEAMPWLLWRLWQLWQWTRKH